MLPLDLVSTSLQASQSSHSTTRLIYNLHHGFMSVLLEHML